MRCPNCGNEIQPEWNVCGYCGYKFPPNNYAPVSAIYATSNTTPPENFASPTPPQNNNFTHYLPYLIGGIAAIGVIALLIIGVINIVHKNSETTTKPYTTAPVSSSDSGNTIFDLPTSTQNSFIQPTDPSLPTSTFLPTKTDAPHLTCPGAEEQRVKVDEKATVCTKIDRLILRITPSLSGEEILRIYPDTVVKVVGGPKCSDNSSWWQVEVSKGTSVFYIHQNQTDNLSEAVQGWVREGSDDKDPYFLCPKN
jgi:hypothetical protein